MSSGLNLVLPWARRNDIYSCAGSLILKLTLGETPRRISQMADVWVGAQSAATGVDGGPVDRVLKHFSKQHSGFARTLGRGLSGENWPPLAWL